MNVQLTNVISDITGLTGQNIIRAIIAGERDPAKLAKLRHERIRATEADIAKSRSRVIGAKNSRRAASLGFTLTPIELTSA